MIPTWTPGLTPPTLEELAKEGTGTPASLVELEPIRVLGEYDVYMQNDWGRSENGKHIFPSGNRRFTMPDFGVRIMNQWGSLPLPRTEQWEDNKDANKATAHTDDGTTGYGCEGGSPPAEAPER